MFGDGQLECTVTDILDDGNRIVEFDDKNNECLGCAMCAMRCPDLAIKEVYRG